MKIIRDTRETKGWDFEFYQDGIDEIIDKKLDYGDYSLSGYEKSICIERKASSGELAQNLGRNHKRFKKQILAMAEYDYKYIVCEFSLKQLMAFPKYSGIPFPLLKKVKITGKFIINCLDKYYSEYGVETIFCGNRDIAEAKAVELLKSFYEEIKSKE